MGDPVVVSTGALYEQVTDYEDADKKLTIVRTYRSKYGMSPGSFSTYALPFGMGDLWHLNFQWELALIPNYFSYNGSFGITSPDGSNYGFKLNSDGTVTVNGDAITDFTVQFVNPSGNQISYADILTNGGQFVITTSSGDQIRMKLFVSNWSKKYAEARPMQITYRGGYAWNLTYGSKDELQTIEDNLGRTISIAWYYVESSDDTGILFPRAIKTISLPDGSVLDYSYEGETDDPSNRLSFVRLKTFTRNSASAGIVDSATYIYDDPNTPSLLTGIVDNAGVRYATWQYDTSGRVLSAQHENGADAVTIGYSSTQGYVYRTVTNALGKQTIYTYKVTQGTSEPLLTSVVGNPSSNCVGTAESVVYDSDKRKTSVVDEAGNTTKYTYDVDGRMQVVTEAFGTSSERVTSYTWNPAFGTPTQIVRPGLTTDFAYDDSGRLLTLTQTDTTQHSQPYSTHGNTRTWSFTYNDRGLISLIDGPLSGNQDATTLEYDARGYLQKVTNAAGHVWQAIALNPSGHPEMVTDPNGVTATMTYDGMGRLSTRTTTSHTTTYQYDAVGNLSSISLSPNGVSVQYFYDNARRLYELRDDIGNRIHYTLDAAGNRIKVDVYDPSDSLRRTQIRVYDELSRLLKIQDPLGQETIFGHDLLGNVNSTTTMGNRTTLKQFDVLNRLIKITDGLQGITRFEYDASDHLVAVTDPRGLVTRYTVDGFGNVIQVTSPDTGTSVFSYDAAGNLLQQRDAKGQTNTYQYDALNRLTHRTFHDGNTTTYIYDQGENGAGHLTTMQDTSGMTTWSYDDEGRVIQKRQTIGGTSLATEYAYDATGHLVSTTLPSGHVANFSWNASQIESVTLDGWALASTIASEPFGDPGAWVFANGERVTRNYDLSGRLTEHSLGRLAYDTGNRVIGLTNSGYFNQNGSWAYGYDALDRLTSYSGTGEAISYRYDANGNRTSQVSSTSPATFEIAPASNRISSVIMANASLSYSYDANGSVTYDGRHNYSYDAAGRLIATDVATYQYNGKGQRVSKTASGTTTLFAYDEANHLVGEYSGNGALRREILWLGDIPLAVVTASGTYYVHTDHLDTPRQIDDTSGQPVWVWNSPPFGTAPPNENPSGLGAFTFNLRFPGQYFDAETGINYNYYRDYDPSTGRYIEADPIGLEGGLNLYAYANQNPLTYVDPNGLAGVLPGPVPFPVPGPVTPGYGSGGSRGDDFGGLFPGMGGKDSGSYFRTPRWPSWPGDDSGSDGEAWPKENKDFCIRTYANCKNYGWAGNCNACLDLCLGSGSGDWPFHMCQPKKKKDRCE
ncbi:RHS repeat protein [Parasulfuritortus cantonensis]|uniref:RHS repeat protein n=1 Tax=Parasulfuritortus cantonensis TaxID=2528202 RepID=A0A4R1BDS6_9PROT|nr:RHS repeat-associated core domain-containing protein [Parasulfuritortus cantonensis]TCJ15239.1 RHS repeat protein [Parasulfuritortus cantonensis]